MQSNKILMVSPAKEMKRDKNGSIEFSLFPNVGQYYQSAWKLHKINKETLFDDTRSFGAEPTFFSIFFSTKSTWKSSYIWFLAEKL